MSRFIRRLRNRRGQSLTEYILIVALVAIASIAILTIFGNQIRSLFSASTQQLQGNTNGQITNQGDPTAVTDKKLDKL